MAPEPHDSAPSDGLPERPPEPSSFPVSRRGFIIGASVAGAAGFAAPMLTAGQAFAAEPAKSFSTWLRRREDFLALRFHFYNLKLSNGQLVKNLVGQPAYFAVEFPSQSVAEQAFFETANAVEPDPDDTSPPPQPTTTDPLVDAIPPIKALVAGASRLAFVVPNGAAIPYTTAGLLGWVKYGLRVVPAATPKGFIPEGSARPLLVAPDERQTQIELPHNLVLSPDLNAGWAHATLPVVHNARTELWHTRLARRRNTGGLPFFIDETATPNRIVRGVWALDDDFTGNLASNTEPVETEPPEPFRTSLTSLDRFDIVRLSADYTLPGYLPQPVDVNRLMLSSLGGWIDVDGAWNPPTTPDYSSDLIQWRHQGVMARDNYVRVVRRGHLFPWGHKAVLIKITERKFVRLPNANTSPRGAYLRQRLFVVVTQPRKSYDDLIGSRYDSRAFPFRSLEITNLVTPNLSPKQQFGGTEGDKIFVMRVDNVPHRFHFVAKDFADQTVEFDAPALFVSSTRAYAIAHTEPIVSTYNSLADDALRVTTLKGQKVAVAEPEVLGDTTIQAETMKFGASVGIFLADDEETVVDDDLMAAGQPRFYPTMAEASTRMAAAEQASGGPLTPSVVNYDPAYVKNAFTAANKSGVFLRMGGTDLKFPTDRSGGVITPNLKITGLSRSLGPVGGDPDSETGLAAGKFEASEFFAGAEAKILGGIDLFDIIEGVTLLGGATDGAMQLKQVELADRVETRLDWHPILHKGPLGINIFVPGDGTRLDLDAVLTTRLTSPPGSSFFIHGRMGDFRLNLIGDGVAQFLIIDVNRLEFTAGSDQKSKVDVDITNTEFAGVLKFVEGLSEFCSFAGGSGPTIDVLGDRIAASIGIELPDISVGVFSLRNIAVFVGIVIPFDGSPVRVRFAFCERSDQFILTVTIFGGGGFFALEIGADGVELMEAGLEFGASCAIDLGVASGSVELMAGIYFKIETKDGVENCTLTGYVRLGGELDVIGLVTVSLEFYMGLEHQSDPEKTVGEATLTVEISVFVFSGSVDVTCRRSFGNGPDDPSFGQHLDDGAWTEYQNAFAVVGV